MNKVARFSSDANSHSTLHTKIAMVKPSALPEEVERELTLEGQEEGTQQVPSFFLQQKHIKRCRTANKRAPCETPTALPEKNSATPND